MRGNSHEPKRWFPTRAQTDPRPDGEFQYAWDFADTAQNGTQIGHEMDSVPGRQVSHTWEAGPATSRQTMVVFAIKPDGGQAILSLAHMGLGWGAEGRILHLMHAGASSFCMSNLKSYLESSTDNRAAAPGHDGVDSNRWAWAGSR